MAFLTTPCSIGQRPFTPALPSQRNRKALHSRVPRACAKDPRAAQRTAERRDLGKYGVSSFAATARPHLRGGILRRSRATTLQINIGLTCNLACSHCHVASSPLRTETMLRSVANRLIALTAADASITTVDITGGAPELHAEFRYLVDAFTSAGLSVIDRCNLVVLEEEGQEDLARFLADRGVRVVASLPCYSAENVERQRGNGVFDSSIRGLQALNAVGYGHPGSGLTLDLVYNPGGAVLPLPQEKLEEDYRRELRRAFNIEFSSLVCIANMPIKRFADDLVRSGEMQGYLNLLVNSFNSATLDSVMCRNMVHVAWDGSLYDCDFNYALAMTMAVDPASRKSPFPMPKGLSVFDIDSWEALAERPIQTDVHCYGCTAGSGSSCGGALTS